MPEINFYAGTDWINSDHVAKVHGDICPRAGEIVEIRRGEAEPILFPVLNVKHIFTDGRHTVDVLLKDHSQDVDRWIASMREA